MRESPWERVGRGRNFEFFATVDELSELLLGGGLPEAYSPYSLVGSDPRRVGARYEWDAFEVSLDELSSCVAAGKAHFFFRSRVLTPDLHLASKDPIEKELSLQGLVKLHVGQSRRGQREASSIGIVNRVRHLQTGDLVSHEGYDRVFQHLKKQLRAILRYGAVYKFPNGTEQKLSGPVISEAMMTLHREGLALTAVPIVP